MIGSKNILLLVSAVLLVCGVNCERGTADQRGLSVGDRPTDAPESSPSKSPPTTKGTSAPSNNGDDDDDDSGKGKGKGMDVPGDDGSGKGKGKGMDVPGDDDDDDDDDSGKGKGKGVDVPSDDYYASYPPMEGKGKGKGKGNISKSSKSDKKSSKKDSKKDGKPTPNPAPTPNIPDEPTSEPRPPSPTTPSPTSANSIPIRTLPYILQYSSVTEVPDTADFAQLAEVTRSYLEEFMVAEFSQTSLTNLDDFVTFMTRNEFEQGEPAIAQYRSTGLFNPSSIFLPTVRELNMLVEEAFTDENLATYLEQVQALPSANPFSATESIIYQQLNDSGSSSPESTSSNVRAAVAAAAAGIVVLVAGLAVMRSRGNTVDGEEESFSPQKDVSGDSTVAGETCNMSLDGSSLAQWKPPTGFKNETQEEDEFEDEPLDSDDEDTLSQPKTRPALRMSSS